MIEANLSVRFCRSTRGLLNLGTAVVVRGQGVGRFVKLNVKVAQRMARGEMGTLLFRALRLDIDLNRTGSDLHFFLLSL